MGDTEAFAELERREWSEPGVAGAYASGFSKASDMVVPHLVSAVAAAQASISAISSMPVEHFLSAANFSNVALLPELQRENWLRAWEGGDTAIDFKMHAAVAVLQALRDDILKVLEAATVNNRQIFDVEATRARPTYSERTAGLD